MSEIMSTRMRTKAFSLFVSINWGCNLVIGVLTLPGEGICLFCNDNIVMMMCYFAAAIDLLGGTKSSMDDDEVGTTYTSHPDNNPMTTSCFHHRFDRPTFCVVI
jgi:hypothetical protein